MKNSECVQSKFKSKKEWQNPQLKKIDIETITANSLATNNDAPGPGTS